MVEKILVSTVAVKFVKYILQSTIFDYFNSVFNILRRACQETRDPQETQDHEGKR